MTDKQIIIDEIDVTSCIYACRKLNKDGLHDCRIPNTAPFCCENIHNCYYKQLKRKEQECERLRKPLIKCDDNIIVDCEYSKKDLCSFIHRKKEVINGLQQQLDQLKKQLEAYKMEADEGKEINAELKAENDTYKKMLEDEDVQLALIEIRSGERHIWYNKANKLSKTLTEIKEIASHYNDMSGNCVIVNFFEDMYKILQKISEVEDGN